MSHLLVSPLHPVSLSAAFTELPEASLHPWFAVRVRSRFEKTCSTYLRARGLDEFSALYRARRRWSDRYKEVELPLFPGYVFCRFDPAERLPILCAPGVVSILSFGGDPYPVEDAEIQAIRAVIDSGLPARPWPFLKTGQRVRVNYGALRDVEGVVQDLKNECRLVISVTLLQRSVSVEIDREWICPVG